MGKRFYRIQNTAANALFQEDLFHGSDDDHAKICQTRLKGHVKRKISINGSGKTGPSTLSQVYVMAGIGGQATFSESGPEHISSPKHARAVTDVRYTERHEGH